MAQRAQGENPIGKFRRPALVAAALLGVLAVVEFSGRREVVRGEIAGQCYANDPRNPRRGAAASPPGKLQVYARGQLHEIDGSFIGEVDLTLQRGRISGHEYLWGVRQVPPHETVKRRLDESYRKICQKNPQLMPERCSALLRDSQK